MYSQERSFQNELNRVAGVKGALYRGDKKLGPAVGGRGSGCGIRESRTREATVAHCCWKHQEPICILGLARFPCGSRNLINKGSCCDFSLLYVRVEKGVLIGTSLERKKQWYFLFP